MPTWEHATPLMHIDRRRFLEVSLSPGSVFNSASNREPHYTTAPFTRTANKKNTIQFEPTDYHGWQLGSQNSSEATPPHLTL